MIDILWQDANYVAICKPAGLASIPGRGEKISAFEEVAAALKLPHRGTEDPRLRLVLVPRKPERFDEVAELVRREEFGLVRRSAPDAPPTEGSRDRPPVVLGDTMGELRQFYGVADVVFVGRTLVDLGARQRGSDMIEPAALAKPVIVGPYTHNFTEAMRRFTAADAVRVVHTPQELETGVSEVLASRDRGARR